MRTLAKLAVIAVAVWAVTFFVPGVHVRHGAVNYLIIAVIFSVVNVLVRPVLKLLAFPLLVLTLGLFLIVINAAVLGLTALATSRLEIDGFGPAVIASLIISAITWTGDTVLGLDERD